MTNEIDTNRRLFLGAAAMTLPAAELATAGQTNDSEPRSWRPSVAPPSGWKTALISPMLWMLKARQF
jgi:hypothetical protein